MASFPVFERDLGPQVCESSVAFPPSSNDEDIQVGKQNFLQMAARPKIVWIFSAVVALVTTKDILVDKNFRESRADAYRISLIQADILPRLSCVVARHTCFHDLII